MFNKLVQRTLGALAAGLVATSAFAQTDAAAERRLDLTRRYFEAVQLETSLRDVLLTVLPALGAGEEGEDGMAPEDRQIFLDAVAETTSEMMEEMTVLMVPVMVEVFTEEELQGLVDFYEGPAGRAMVAKMPEFNARMAPLLGELSQKMTGELLIRVCARLDCEAQPAPEPQPSGV